jgi:hypothetical protein
MTQDELRHLASGWIGYWHAPEGSPLRKSLSWASDRVIDLMLDYDEGEELWDLILAIHRTDQSPAVQQVLSAGPVEALLAKHGNAFIARIEHEARADSSFAQLLGGVWRSSIADSV